MIMRKFKILLLFIVLLPFTVFSQVDSVRISKLPRKGSFMIETGFTPFQDDKILNFEYFQTKIWIKDRTALRLGVKLNHESNAVKRFSNIRVDDSKEQFTVFGFRTGFQSYLLKKSRIAPYMGAEFIYEKKGADVEMKDGEKLIGAWARYSVVGNNGDEPLYETDYVERAYRTRGLNVLLGTDVFVWKYLYLGFEVGLGYEVTKYDEIIRKNADQETTIEDIKVSSRVGFYAENAIRLGIWF